MLGEIEYPLDFPIKVMGHAGDGFDALVVSLVRKHAPDRRMTAFEYRAGVRSKRDRHRAQTCA